LPRTPQIFMSKNTVSVWVCYGCGECLVDSPPFYPSLDHKRHPDDDSNFEWLPCSLANWHREEWDIAKFLNPPKMKTLVQAAP